MARRTPPSALWAFAVLVGCAGKPDATGPGFEPGNNLPMASSPPLAIRVVLPAEDLVMSAGEPLDCLVEVGLRAGDPPPPVLFIAYVRGGNPVTSMALEPDSTSKGKYLYKCSLPAAPKPGKYQLRVEAAYRAPTTSKEGTGGAPRDAMHRMHATGPNVEFRR